MDPCFRRDDVLMEFARTHRRFGDDVCRRWCYDVASPGPDFQSV